MRVQENAEKVEKAIQAIKARRQKFIAEAEESASPSAHYVVNKLALDSLRLEDALLAAIEGFEGTYGADFWESPLAKTLVEKLKVNKWLASLC